MRLSSLRKALPWLVALAVLVFLAQRYSFAEIGKTLARGEAFWLVPLAALASVVSLFWMSLADWILFRKNLSTLSFRDLLRGRGAASLIGAASFGAGQGSYALWLARKTSSSALHTAGLLAHLMLCDLSAVCIVAALSLSLSDSQIAPELHHLTLGIAPLIAVSLVALAFVLPWLLPNLSSRFPILKHLESLTSPWTDVPPTSYLLSLLCRIGNLLSSILFWYLAAQALALDAPFSAFLSYLPIIYLVGSLPLNVGPFGVVQAVWIYFFKDYGSPEEILALQVSFGALLSLGFALRALPFLQSVTRDLQKQTTLDS